MDIIVQLCMLTLVVNLLQFETEDLTLSQNSLPGEFDYTEPVQS